MRKVNLAICVVCVLFVTNTLARDLVFRSDTRAPEEIYHTGFTQLGDNDNILLHIEGESCLSGTRDTIFVATSTNYNFAVNFSQNVPAGELFWVYSIRPSNNFYSAYQSLMYAYAQSHNEVFLTTANSFMEQREYMAFGGISSAQIMGARRYRSNGYGSPATQMSYSANPYYVEDHTDVNHEPYPKYYEPTPSSSISLSSCERCINSTSPLIKENGKELAGRIISCKYLLSILISE